MAVQLNVCGMDKVLCGLAGVAESCSVWEWITTDEKTLFSTSNPILPSVSVPRGMYVSGTFP